VPEIFTLIRMEALVTSDGDLLDPQLTIPQGRAVVTIATDGTVSFTQPGQTATQIAGQIQLANFANPGGLNSLGGSLYTPTDASGDPIVGNPGGQEGLGSLLQGYTEQSNVSVVDEFVNLIVRAARLRGQLESGQGRRRNVSTDEQRYPMIMAIPIFLALAAQADGCLAIPADRILVRDITEAVPALRPLPGDLVLGYAPAPGVRRSLLGATLERFAKNHGVDAKGLPDVCVEHPMIAPSDARVTEAMQEAWNESDEKVRFEFDRMGTARSSSGKLIFPRAGIQPPVGIDPKPQVLWRGYVLYGAGNASACRQRCASRSVRRAWSRWLTSPPENWCGRIRCGSKAAKSTRWIIAPRAIWTKWSGSRRAV